MTASLQLDSKSPSRRAVLAGALGGLGALVASAIGRPSIAQAHDPDDVWLGGINTATTSTLISNTANQNAVFVGWGFANGTGVQGYSGDFLPDSKAKTGIFGSADQDGASKGVWGDSPAGHGLHGSSTSGYGGYFAGKVYTTKWYELTEISTPAAPGTNRARLFARVNSSGKTQLCVRFQSGAVQVIKTEL